jgi:hypothetical protein
MASWDIGGDGGGGGLASGPVYVGPVSAVTVESAVIDTRHCDAMGAVSCEEVDT